MSVSEFFPLKYQGSGVWYGRYIVRAYGAGDDEFGEVFLGYSIERGGVDQGWLYQMNDSVSGLDSSPCKVTGTWLAARVELFTAVSDRVDLLNGALEAGKK